jgi:hypothetical protein
MQKQEEGDLHLSLKPEECRTDKPSIIASACQALFELLEEFLRTI